MGLDIDRDALLWGMQRNGEGLADTAQPCLWLLHGDVTQPLARAVLVDCPVSSNSSHGNQPSVEQSIQDMSIHGNAAAANGVDGSSGSTPDGVTNTGRAPVAEAGQSSKSSVHNTSCKVSSVAPSLPDQSASGPQAKPVHQRPTEHHMDDPQGKDLPIRRSESKGAGLNHTHGKAEACRAADIICAFNFSVCLLHQRSEVQVIGRPISVPSVYAVSIAGIGWV